MLLALIAITTLASQAQKATQANQRCIPQPMPPAIDSAGELPIASDVIEFAATPALQYPGRAWVVRVYRRGAVEAKIEVVRLRRRNDCNRYDIEARWRSPLQQADYVALAETLVPIGVPAASVFVPSSSEQLPELVLDGTGIDLRLRSAGWQVSRSLNHYGQFGGTISEIFRHLSSKYVPESELPKDDWRTK